MNQSSIRREFTLPLPEHYRISDILPYHERDRGALSEVVTGSTLRKAILWQYSPVEIQLNFSDDLVHAVIYCNDPPQYDWNGFFSRCIQRMCGLTQPIDLFRDQWGQHEELQPLFDTGTHLRFALTPTVFEALSWAVVSQQISVKAAVQLRHRMIKVCSVTTESGLYCYPDAKRLSQVTLEDLLAIGFPKAKAETLHRLCDFALDQDLDELDGNNEHHMYDLSQRLLAIKGIGHWTVNYGLLRGYGYLDGSLHGDIALRRALQILWQHPDDITDKQAEAWLSQFTPWRALVAAYLWQYTGA
ncbi:MAG: DNA-3-methyladenine glycosylase 2 family protein [Betaproteobacteria bacterium]|nr:DNA-3-methyladenine glycosylase 2 family protein [Betaproteobacteria bacterium]MDE2055601.1 DNA-3-methyladenine glycosylase 2 family protein [Betaproteobacteria bacterium]